MGERTRAEHFGWGRVFSCLVLGEVKEIFSSQREERDPESKLKRPPRAGSGLRPGTAAQVGISWCPSTVVLSHKGTTALERVGVNAEELFWGIQLMSVPRRPRSHLAVMPLPQHPSSELTPPLPR